MRKHLEILRGVLATEFKREDPERRLFSQYFYIYYKKQGVLGSVCKFDELKNFIENVLKVTDGKGKRVLDFGCGFGLRSILFALCGAREVYSCDINKEKIENFRRLLGFLKPPLDNIWITQTDVCKSGYNKAIFDVVFASSVLSHVRDPFSFLSEVHRILKPGGFLFLYDENNSLYLRGRYRRRKFWQMCEYGPVNKIAGLLSSYSKLREEIILKHYPSLEIKLIKVLVKKTQGLYGNEIVRAVSSILKGQNFKSPKFKYRDPVTGNFPERELNPFKVLRTLKQTGFKCKIIRFHSPYYNGFRGLLKKLLIQSEMFPMFIPFIYSNFFLLGKREGKYP